MRKTIRPKPILLVAASTAGLLIAWISGCSSNNETPAPTAAAPTTQPFFAGIFTPPQKAGAQLWAENCTRCHYAPSPDRFSDGQWEVIVHHMRLRADLTGEEARQITAFLKASN